MSALKNHTLRTWCACYVSWNFKKNNEANTMPQVELHRQNGKKAMTKLLVPDPMGPTETCFDVLVSSHEPWKERLYFGISVCRDLAKVKKIGDQPNEMH